MSTTGLPVKDADAIWRDWLTELLSAAGPHMTIMTMMVM
jgi:hypothetical protein